jgi:hypothetical protein
VQIASLVGLEGGHSSFFNECLLTGTLHQSYVLAYLVPLMVFIVGRDAVWPLVYKIEVEYMSRVMDATFFVLHKISTAQFRLTRNFLLPFTSRGIYAQLNLLLSRMQDSQNCKA